MERWKQIKEFPDYSVSNLGSVRRDTDGNGNNTWAGRLMKWTKNDRGYLQVGLYRDGEVTIKSVHRLVAQAFVPNPAHLPIVHHRDFNKANPVATNLRWVTVRENEEFSAAARRQQQF